MALGDVVKIDSDGETQYDNLQQAINNLPAELTENTILEIRTNNAISGAYISGYQNKQFFLTIKSGSGYSGRIAGVGYQLYITDSKNIIIDNVEVEDTANDEISPISLGVSNGATKVDSICIQNCTIIGRRGLHANHVTNLVYKNNDVQATLQVLWIEDAKAVEISNNTYTFSSPAAAGTIAMELHRIDKLNIHDQVFPDLSFRTWVIRGYDCKEVLLERLWVGNSVNVASSISEAIGFYTESVNATYSCDDLRIENCVFHRDRRSLYVRDVRKINIIGCTIISEDWYSGYAALIVERSTNIRIRNNVFDMSSPTHGATSTAFYDVELYTSNSEMNYEIDYNSFYSGILAPRWIYNDVDGWTAGRTFSDLADVQAELFETHSYMEASPFVNTSNYLVSAGSNARNNGDTTYVNASYFDFDEKVRPTDSIDMGAVDNDSTVYTPGVLTPNFYVHNTISDDKNTTSDTDFPVASGDLLYLISDLGGEPADSYIWIYDNGVEFYSYIGKIAYIEVADQDTYDLQLTVNNGSDYSINKANYLIVEKPRPVAAYDLQFEGSPLYVNQLFSLLDNSEHAETWFWEIETAPESGVFTEYNTEDLIDLSLSTSGQYTVRLTVTNSDTYSGIRSNTLEAVKSLNVAAINPYPIFDIDVPTVCHAGESVQFTIVPENDFTIASVEWRINNAKSSNPTAHSPIVKFETVGRYDVAVKVTTTTGYSNWVYKRRLVTVLPAHSGRTTHIVDLTNLPLDSEKPWCKYEVNGTTIGVQPGDLVLFTNDLPTNWGLVVREMYGTTENPIIISHVKDEVIRIDFSKDFNIFNNGLYTIDCEHCIFDFKNFTTPSNSSFGLELNLIEFDQDIESGSGACKFSNWSTDIEACGIHILASGFPAFQAKTEPDEYNVVNPKWDGFQFNNCIIHNCRIEATVGEGFYLGFNNISGISGVDVRPHVMENGLIYRNVVKNSQKDGFQYGNATGIWEIHDNEFYNIATLDEGSQNSVMSINVPRINCKTYIYNNYAAVYPNNAISLRIAKEMYVFNNTFIGAKNPGNQIYLHNDCEEDCDILVIANNTIDGRDYAMYLNVGKTPYSGAVKQIHECWIVNNIHIVADAEEISAEKGNLALLDVFDSNECHGYDGQSISTNILSHTVSNNLFIGRSNINKFFFNDFSKYDARIQSGGIAADAGIQINALVDPFISLGIDSYDLAGYMTPLNSDLVSIGSNNVITGNDEVIPSLSVLAIDLANILFMQHYGAVNAVKNCPALNQFGCTIFVDDIENPTVKKYVPFNQQNQPILTEGDIFDSSLWYSDNPFINGGHNNSESKTDWTNGGINTQIPPDLSAVAIGDEPVSLGVRYFLRYRYNSEGVLIGADRICIYDKDQDAPTSTCFNKTIAYVN